MSPVFAFLTAFCLFLQGTVFKLYEQKVCSISKSNDYLFYTINFGFCALSSVVICAFVGFDATSILYGCGAGVIFCTMIVTFAQSLKRFSIAFTDFILMFACILPITVSAIWLQEAVTTMQWFGFALLAIAAYVVCLGDVTLERIRARKINKNTVNSSNPQIQNNASSSYTTNSLNLAPSQEAHLQVNASSPQLTNSATAQPAQNAKSKLGKILILVLAVVSNGGLSTYIKLTYKIFPSMNNYSFLLTMFAVATLICIALTAATTRGFVNIRQVFANKLFLVLSLCIGALTLVGNIAFNYFSVRIESGVFYPIISALPMLLAALVSPLFKEKLSLTAIIGISIGIVGIILLNL